MRKAIIAGNWKMNMTPTEAKQLVRQIKEYNLDQEVEACLCVPFIDLPAVVEEIGEGAISVGAQNMHYEEKGAYTGEISGPMLKELGVRYVILGHSERRQYFHEDDDLINRKLLSALNQNLRPILCVGESLEEREKGQEKDKVKEQLSKDLDRVTADHFSDIVIAYEPIWAIGTGKTASAEDAEDMCRFIRNWVEENYGEMAAVSVRIQYGGSVKPENVCEIMEKANIDGALVGGASLKAESFSALVNYKN